MKRKGFTLIELVVVMAIIAVLALLVVGAITAARRASLETIHRSNTKSVQTALEAYYTRNRQYPTVGTLGTTYVGCNALFGAGQPLAGYGNISDATSVANEGCDVSASNNPVAVNHDGDAATPAINVNYHIRTYQYDGTTIMTKDYVSGP